MRLYFVGTVHHDPLCRLEYVRWLEAFHEDEPRPPSLVAVEWDPEHFASVKRQREDLPGILEELWPGTPASITGDLQATLAYEGDAHESVYGKLAPETMLWLDHGRPTIAIIEGYARAKVEIYRGWLPDPRSLPRPRMDALRALQAAFPVQHSDVHATERGYADDVWADKIAQRAMTDGWGLVVVGAAHAELREGMLRPLLINRGLDCVAAVQCSYRRS